MPEGPEVYNMASQMRSLVGLYLISVEYDSNSRYSSTGLPNINLAKGTILDVISHGKKIIIRLPEIYLLSSMGLEGRWYTTARNNSNLWLNIGKKLGRLNIIETKLWFDDSRHFGTLEILNVEQLEQRFLKIGPCLIKNKASVADWYTKAISSKQQVCQFLMDQSHWAGVGNYLKAEILYRCRIKPDRIISQLTADQLELLRTTTLDLIQQACSTNIIVIYRKKISPCGNIINKGKFKDNRTTYWVPAVQE
jgi:formamidopyrimidine-DNA glycosylase